MLSLRTKDYGKDGQQCGELAASEQGPCWWIEVIDTYDITFQHRPGLKHGNADALSRYLCRQCGGKCEGDPAQGV